MTPSPLKVDVQVVQKEAVREVERRFAQAQTTKDKHYARLALQRARRALGRSD